MKRVFHTRPNIPSDRLVPIVDGLKWRIVSKSRANKRGEPLTIGMMVYQPSKNRFIVYCFDRECEGLAAGAR